MYIFLKRLKTVASLVLLAGVSILASPVLAEPDDGGLKGGLTVDRLEAQQSTVDQTDYHYWHADAWVGDEKNRLFLKTEGAHSKGLVSDGLHQLLYGRAVSESWFLEAGLAVTGSPGPTRNWFALTAEGDLPFDIDSEWMLFLGKDNQAWLRTQFETAVALSEPWKFVPKLEVNFYARDNPFNEVGSGFSSAELSLRLVYDFSKNLGGYVGYSRYQAFGNTADELRVEDNSTFDNLVITGLMISL